ncbi:restriction endonuclease subunit S [Elizabethkingia anophelis]|uniref:restriction endonuclease subunit S n=1 Tax=Elizabethkingia anophelis TaxID=1117645 RepID=UPI0021A56ADB|nr:restriction endonuclease subunit S [Elizabethkingia anophelis]MCT3836184.1 restriction endonuclease subunit S [Elizabethkingia anophelis]MCT3839642.1 restriction endonuclease subunit S [Elizabethkingia anophelis]MCT3846988.1 restriction endonuclease subunit S [Elizabethkingia anophelis]MCT3889584.1 restriction endonuclease subunit S [Elizabethkingia anophelis]
MRFSEFTEEWKTKKLGEIGDVKMCRRIFNDETEPMGDIPFFKIGSFGKEADAFISKELYLDYRKRFSFPKKGDILISAAGTIGRTVVYDGNDAYFQDSNIVWVDNDNKNITNEFLYYILQIVKYNTEGGTIQRLYNNVLKSTKFSSPSIQEQEKISSFLSLLDERIHTQNKIIKELNVLKTTITKRIFSGQLRFKNASGDNYEDWKTKKLGDVTTLINKRNKNNEKLPVYSINNKLGFVPQSEQFEGVDSEDRGYDITLYKIIDKNTFAYNPARINVGSIGYSGNLENIIISSLYVCFKTEEFVNDNFLFQYLKTDFFNKEVLRNVEGGVRDYLFYENFARIKFDLPCVEEQRKIADYLSSIDLKVDIEIQILNKLEEQKKFLLQQMFV